MNLDNTLTAGRNQGHHGRGGRWHRQAVRGRPAADSMHLRLGPLGNHPCPVRRRPVLHPQRRRGLHTGYRHPVRLQQALAGHAASATTQRLPACCLNVVPPSIKSALTIPCGMRHLQRIPAHAPDFFEQAHRGRQGRLLPDDPPPDRGHRVRQQARARAASTRSHPCTRCLHCHIGPATTTANAQGYCRVNALTQRVMTRGRPGHLRAARLPRLPRTSWSSAAAPPAWRPPASPRSAATT